MDSHFYHTGQFAQKADVSVRTLRYYDKVGLLSPSYYTEAGYRLYTDTDFSRLQQILALKFLGFSLGEIKQCLRIEPAILQESLAFQKTMMQDKREQLDTVIAAIEQTEKLLQTNSQDWEAIVHVIQVIQMTQSNDWRKKHFSAEQLQQMEELSKQAYTEEDRQKLAEWGKNWTEEDQRIASQRWSAVIAELQRLVSTGEDPASPTSQAFVQQWLDLRNSFTRGDLGISKGLNTWYEKLSTMPATERPFPLPYNQEEETFLRKALEIYKENQGHESFSQD